MLRLIIILFFSSTLFSQVQTESWLDYVIEENKEEISATSSTNIDNEFYYTIQIAVKKTFDEAMEVVQALNASDIDAFIQKNDANSEYKYRVRYGNFSNRDDAVNLAARLEAQTRQEDTPIIVSEFTYMDCPNIAFSQLGEVTVKGKEEPVKIYAPLFDGEVRKLYK